MLAPLRRRLLLELLEDRAVPAAISTSPGVLTIFGAHGADLPKGGGSSDFLISLDDKSVSRMPVNDALPDHVDEALGYTCSFLSALASFAPNRPDSASQVRCDLADNPDPEPMFVDDYSVDVGSRQSGEDVGSWPVGTKLNIRHEGDSIIADREREAAEIGIVMAIHPGTVESWRHPAIALTPLTIAACPIDAGLTDLDKQLLESALHDDYQDDDVLTDSIRLASHVVGSESLPAESMVEAFAESCSGFAFSRRHWGIDASAGLANSWSNMHLAAFSNGADHNASAQLQWNPFSRVVSTVMAA